MDRTPPADIDDGVGPAKAISFCVIDGRAILLDRRRDRYFCLSPAGNKALLDAVGGKEVTSGDRAKLVAAGVLADGDAGGPLLPTPMSETPQRSLLDDAPRARIVETALALQTIARLRVRLRMFGFDSLLTHFTRQKAATSGAPPPRLSVLHAVAGFCATRALVAEHDHCLIRSFAVGARLVRLGAQPSIILGVKLRPFKAHCWTILDDEIVNDRYDVIREFTPILTL